MRNEQRMYVAVEAREDFVYIDGNGSKFYQHPTLKGIYASRDGEIAKKRINGKIVLVPQYEQNNGYLHINLGDISEETSGNKLVHRIVLETFTPQPDTEQDWVCDHINDKRYDNRLQNLQWLSRSENLKKRDEAGSLYKPTFVYDRVTDKVTEYASRLEAADAIGYFVSNMVTAMKKEIVIRGRYFVTDVDALLPEDYFYIFKEYDLKKELRQAQNKKKQIILNKLQGIGA